MLTPRPTPRLLRLAGATGTIRTATYQSREHLVVPVVALVEGVIHAVNADTPELVLAEDIALLPGGWNGRPAFCDHPEISGAKVSGNSPRVLETSFGTVFNTASADQILQSKRLTFEVWLDPERAATLGSGPSDIVARVLAGDPIEVSVGVFVLAESRSGTYNGKTYKAQWKNITPDHIALLSKGSIGACSIDMGCGAPRAATRAPITHRVTADGISFQGDPPMTVIRSLRERLLSMFKVSAGTDGTSDYELRRSLEDALRAIEPAFLGVYEVFQDTGTVIYDVMPEDRVMTFRRGFTLGDGAAVTLADDREEVHAVVQYEPVTTAATTTRTAASCACGNSPTAPTLTGAQQMDKQTRITALIGHKTKVFTDADRPMLEAADDARLAALSAALDAVPASPAGDPLTPTPDPATGAPSPTATPVPAPAPVTAEQYVASAPPEVRDMLNAGMRAAAREKQTVIDGIKATGRCPFTDAQLASKSIDELRSLAALAGVPEQPAEISYIGRPVPRAASDDNRVPDPPDFIGAIRAASAK